MRKPGWFAHVPLMYLIPVTLALPILQLLNRYHYISDVWGAPEQISNGVKLSSTALATLGAYGVYTCFTLHPLLNDRYREWLEHSPWRYGLPLPLGPVWIGPAQVFTVASVIAMTCASGYLVEPLRPLIPWWIVYGISAFCIGYSAMVAATFVMLKQYRAACLLGVLLPLALPALKTPPLLGATAAACMTIAMVGLQRSLRAFPWPHPAKRLSPTQFGLAMAAPVKVPVYVRPRVGLAVALLCGWLVLLVYRTYESTNGAIPNAAIVAQAIGLASLSAVVRILIYCAYQAAPITMGGRLFTRFKLIPAYDRVLVAPLVTLISGPVVASLCSGLGSPMAMSLAVTTTFAAALTLGPDWRDFHLTGAARYRRPPLLDAGTAREYPGGEPRRGGSGASENDDDE